MGIRTHRSIGVIIATLVAACSLVACGGGGGGSGSDNGRNVPATNTEYIVFAWNDLGMHCLNPTYDTAVILPPYNTVWAQVVKRGNPPQVAVSGLTVEYRIVNNTSSIFFPGTQNHKRQYYQFWDYAAQLFPPYGASLQPDKGLNLADPLISNGLSGSMVAKADHFQVNGIPVVPVDDSGTWNPYQVAEVTVKNASGQVVAQTRTTVPTSDEIHCDKCHLPAPANGNNAFMDILQKHDQRHQSPGNLVQNRPILCASCHGSPALGSTSAGSSGEYLSAAIHGSHASRLAPDGTPITCYDCHPGTKSQCNRSIAHTSSNGNCTACHGSMQDVAASISTGRIPWGTEPKCATCHTNVAEVDTGTTLYRNAAGHGGVYCAGCHGSPHTMFPSRLDTDNYQPIQYQGVAKSMGTCSGCHSSSRGEGSGEFLEEHGSGRNPSHCSVCHTAFTTTNTNSWPHQYQWRSR